MTYQPIKLQQKIAIHHLYTVHYFEYMSDFSFEGESHDFWEILYVDKGEVVVCRDEEEFILKEGEMVFHMPNEFHNIRANGQIAPNLVVVSFESRAKAMDTFIKKKIVLNKAEKTLLGNITIEAEQTYTNILGDPYYKKLYRKSSVPFGSEQLIKLYLEQLLICVYRRNSCAVYDEHVHKNFYTTATESKLHEQIHNYLIDQMPSSLTLEKICMDNLISISKVQKLIKSQHNCGVIEYYNYLKIEKAKQLIRNKNMNFTQIAEVMGYSSIHYFTKQFKQLTAMTPSQYASSIRTLAIKDE